MDKIVYFIAFCTIFLLGSCNSSQNSSLDFMTIFNVYRWSGKDKSTLYEERYAKIMEFLDNYDSEETYTGIDSMPLFSFDITPGLYRYIAKCSGTKFEHLNFKPLSDQRCGIAYLGQIDSPKDTEASLYDYLKIYFQDTLSAKSFVDEAVKFGFKRVSYDEWASYKKINPTENPQVDSILLEAKRYAAYYYDPECVVSYSVGVFSHKDKNVVILSWCP